MGGILGGASTPPPPAPITPPKEPTVNEAVKTVSEMDRKRKRQGRASSLLSTEESRQLSPGNTWTASKSLLGE